MEDEEEYVIPEPEEIERKCLRCDKMFTAEGKFVRLCRQCKIYRERYGPFDGEPAELKMVG